MNNLIPIKLLALYAAMLSELFYIDLIIPISYGPGFTYPLSQLDWHEII